jgi:hypothetical protein
MAERIVGSLHLDDEAWLKELKAFQDRVEDPRALWDPVIEYMTRREREVWATQGRSEQTPWPPAGGRSQRRTRVGKKTAKRRRLRGSHELMVLTGRLRASLIVPRGAGGIRRKSRSQLVFGTRVKTANLHQNSKGGRLPRRAVLDPTEADAKAFRELVVEYVLNDNASSGGLPQGGAPL